MRLYRREICAVCGGGGQTRRPLAMMECRRCCGTGYTYQELTPAELAALNLAGLVVIREIEEALCKSKTDERDEKEWPEFKDKLKGINAGFEMIKKHLAGLKSKYLSPDSLSQLEKKLVQADLNREKLVQAEAFKKLQEDFNNSYSFRLSTKTISLKHLIEEVLREARSQLERKGEKGEAV